MTWSVGLHGWPVSQWEDFHGQSVAGLRGQLVVSSVGSVNQKLEWWMGLSPEKAQLTFCVDLDKGTNPRMFSNFL